MCIHSFRDYLWTVTSSIYAVGVVVVGFVMYMTDVFIETENNYLMGEVSFLYPLVCT